MKKFLILMLFPLLITAQESHLNNDFISNNHFKRKKLLCGISSEIYKTNKLSSSDDISLSVGYIIFDNIYLGTQINSNGPNLVNRIYMGYNSDFYLIFKYHGSIENGRTTKSGLGYEYFFNKFFSVNSEILFYTYKRKDIETRRSINLGEFLSDFNSGITTYTEYINEDYESGIFLVGFQIHF